MLRSIKIVILLLVLSVSNGYSLILQQSVIRGTVRDLTGSPLPDVHVIISGTPAGTTTDATGSFQFRLAGPPRDITLIFSYVGYTTETRKVRCQGTVTVPDIIMHSRVRNVGEITVTSQRVIVAPGLTRIPVKDIALLPSASGSFEALLKTFPGVASHNELSSQYSVRGGSFDENLVYVNDMEVFRPFLIRSGQQEGLSFINPDLVSSVSFSSGGFGASYGDRMSSVLDVRYRQPESFHASVQIGLLLNSLHLEGTDRSKKMTWLIGTRYKSSSMMLNTFDSKGDYLPFFADIQSILTLKTGPGSMLSLLSSYASNSFKFKPQSLTSTFGTEAEAYQLFVLFQGGENDHYSTLNNSLTWEFTGNRGGRHKLMVSAYVSREIESFDIRGNYRLDNLDKNSGSENFTDSIMNIGIGSFLSHARNRLSAIISSFQYKGEKASGNLAMNWGVSLRNDDFTDRIREWKLVDSAGYSVPYTPQNLQMSSFISAGNHVTVWSGSGWGEITERITAGQIVIRLNAGLRGLYNSFTDEFLVSPRLSARVNPSRNLAFWLSGGLYVQPPFYREMRFPDGTINRNILAQKSFHAVAGFSYDFTAWERPFRLNAELYNKQLYDIIPYHLDNVRLIYSGVNSATGFSRGIDLRLNGEFIEGAESWVSLSVMDSKLKIKGSGYGYFPSPSDQTFSTNIFFQDYFPSYPSVRAHLNISFASGLPIISPFNERYDRYFRLPPYRRADIGFTKVIKSKNQTVSLSSFLRHFEELVAGIEVYNILDINNTVSYFWVKTITNLSGDSRQYAIPDYLTGRCLNFRLIAKF